MRISKTRLTPELYAQLARWLRVRIRSILWTSLSTWEERVLAAVPPPPPFYQAQNPAETESLPPNP